MDRGELRATVVATLQRVAPEVEGDDLRDTRPLRDQVDLDSLDWLSFLIGLHDAVGVDIPAADDASLVTLADVLDYLQDRLPAAR
ncbi:MAG: phosphopantetheine-binding protein [Actinomycetes bacterium]|nr:phosphopantetheine-binding protein [Actinomycetes bacterium]MDX5400038.1 phosphopantetheine-binding protein [Actinomycetes bacterium]MDX5450692.1 phosphopantetheine-binding protein [Actinomycetes bacterium]